MISSIQLTLDAPPFTIRSEEDLSPGEQTHIEIADPNPRYH